MCIDARTFRICFADGERVNTFNGGHTARDARLWINNRISRCSMMYSRLARSIQGPLCSPAVRRCNSIAAAIRIWKLERSLLLWHYLCALPFQRAITNRLDRHRPGQSSPSQHRPRPRSRRHSSIYCLPRRCCHPHHC